MSILTDQQITDLAFLLSVEYHDHIEDQAVAFDSYEETITEWSETFGEHKPYGGGIRLVCSNKFTDDIDKSKGGE